MRRITTALRLPLVALALAAWATFAPAQSEVETARIVIRTQPTVLPSPLLLKISGVWPTQCSPTLERVTLDGMDLNIEARSVLSLCARHQTGFSIEVNPALASNHATLPPGIYRVGFYAASGNQDFPKLRAFSLLDNTGAANSVVPESGFWWNSSDLQIGAHRIAVSLELQGSQLSVALLSYDDTGNPVWQFGTAAMKGSIAHVPLLKMTGGSDPFATSVLSPRGEATLTLDMEFHSGAHASAWLSRRVGALDDPVLELQPMDLIRLPSVNAGDAGAWEGDWILTADSNSATPQRLRFGKLDGDATHFELVDEQSNLKLTCTHNGGQVEQLPKSCVLRQADGAEVGHFGAPAISRMEGKRPDGVTLHLIRIAH